MKIIRSNLTDTFYNISKFYNVFITSIVVSYMPCFEMKCTFLYWLYIVYIYRINILMLTTWRERKNAYDFYKKIYRRYTIDTRRDNKLTNIILVIILRTRGNAGLIENPFNIKKFSSYKIVCCDYQNNEHCINACSSYFTCDYFIGYIFNILLRRMYHICIFY